MPIYQCRCGSCNQIPSLSAQSTSAQVGTVCPNFGSAQVEAACPHCGSDYPRRGKTPEVLGI